jgi:hypothetical protein
VSTGASLAAAWQYVSRICTVDSARRLPRGYNRPLMEHLPMRAWREVAADWRVWLSLALCLLIATIAWLMGLD